MGNAKHTGESWGVATIDGGAAPDEIVTEVNGCMVNIAALFGACEYSEARQNGEAEPHYEVSAEEVAANARLIAAAPELLAALEALCKAQEYGDVVSWAPEWDNAYAAIAKAQGGEQ